MNQNFSGRWPRAAAIVGGSAALVVTAAQLAPQAAGDPNAKGPCLNLPGAVVCVEDPPGMNYNAVPLQKCNSASGRYIFGRGPDGQNLVCAGYPAVWNRGPTLFGVQAPGGVCPFQLPMIGIAAAQTVDGRPLICGEQGWFIN